jgi:hypothetical protein
MGSTVDRVPSSPPFISTQVYVIIHSVVGVIDFGWFHLCRFNLERSKLLEAASVTVERLPLSLWRGLQFCHCGEAASVTVERLPLSL